MPIIVPELDDRNYDEILAEATARIPVHTPEWTNFNDSDPGITLLQLFAFMTENLLYRSNQIPERNRLKFLKLLGIPLQPATPASGFVQFSNTRGPLKTLTLPAGLEVFAGQLPFRTQNGLNVLPIEAQVFYKRRLSEGEAAGVRELYEQLYASFQEPGVSFDLYETRPLEPPSSEAEIPAIDLSKETVDSSLWVALLARSADVLDATRNAIANTTLTLGVLPGLSDASRVLRAGGSSGSDEQQGLVFQIPQLPEDGLLPVTPSLRVARYRTLDARTSGDLLAAPGTVQLPLPGADELRLWANLEPQEQGVGDFPPSVEETDVQDRVITWIRIRLPQAEENTQSSQFDARLSWVGINVAGVQQYAHVTNEPLGRGTGEPDQRVTLANTPVLKGSVQLTVNGETWEEIDDLLAAGPEVSVRSARLTPGLATSGEAPVQVYTLDRESGEIRFGTGIHGMRPPAGATIQASYNYGGGRQGNVGIGAVNKGPLLPAGVKVSNPLPTWGGDEAERVEDGERRIPAYLRHQDRAVSTADFEDIVWRTPGVDLGRVEVLPLFHPATPLAAAGVVTLMVIPQYDPVQPEAPQPDRLFLDAICQHVNPRRLVTTEVHVRGPIYEPVWVSVGIDVVPGQDVAPVQEAVKNEVRAFLSPLTGGFEGGGWPLNTPVDRLELWAVAARVEGVARVKDVLLGGATGDPVPSIELTGLRLPRLAGIRVQPGDPQALGDLRGDVSAGGDGDGQRLLPVPVVPEEC